MKICKPYKEAKYSHITNGFSQEHNANDFAYNYGTFLVAPFNCKIVNIVGIEREQDPHDFGSLENGYGVRLQSTEDPTISLTYWHCLAVFPVKKGDYVGMGQVVAQMGNSGFVMAGDKYVEINRRIKHPFPGTHTHITMGQEVNGVYSHWDYSEKIDWKIEINYSIIEAIRSLLQSIFNFLNKK